jgi:hypothetical protein
MTVKVIEKFNVSNTKDEELVAAVSGQTTKINAINIIAENDTDLTHKCRWFITDGQLWDAAARIANTSGGNVSDGNTVSITTNAGQTVVFEFDNDSSVTGTNTSVTLGASFNESLTNLNTAINAAITAGTLFGISTAITLGTPSGTGGESYIDITDDTLDKQASSNPHTVVRVGSNLTVTDFTGGGADILVQGFAWNHTPVVLTNFLSTFAAGTANTAVNLSVEVPSGHYGFNIVGNIYYTTSA